MTSDSENTDALLDRVLRGDSQALQDLLTRYRPTLLAFIEARLDPRVRARVGAEDVVQFTLMEVVRRLDDYLQRRPMPFHLWVRKTAYERLLNVHRDHRAPIRDIGQEECLPARSSLLLVKPLLAQDPSPSREAAAREFAERVSQAVAQLEEADREILLLRHVDELPYDEIGCLLDLDAAAARKRYGRALIRLRKVLTEKGLLEPNP